MILTCYRSAACRVGSNTEINAKIRRKERKRAQTCIFNGVFPRPYPTAFFMDNNNTINAFITPETVDAYTFPCGPRGVGIKSISQDGNIITVTYDDGRINNLTFPVWWFGTRAQYNALSVSDRMNYYIYFIEEDS